MQGPIHDLGSDATAIADEPHDVAPSEQRGLGLPQDFQGVPRRRMLYPSNDLGVVCHSKGVKVPLGWTRVQGSRDSLCCLLHVLEGSG